MTKAQVFEATRSYFPLIDTGDGYFVLVSHRELDNLIANLMHIAELDSDKEHRDALKGELKHKSRFWLDSLYEESGYTNHSIAEHADIHKIDPQIKRER